MGALEESPHLREGGNNASMPNIPTQRKLPPGAVAMPGKYIFIFRLLIHRFFPSSASSLIINDVINICV